MTLGKDGEKSQ